MKTKRKSATKKVAKKKVVRKKSNLSGVSAAQKKARANFVKMIAEAKRIKKANPGMKWQSCIKKAAK